MMKPGIVCYGEVLWDLLPSEKVPGGAPMNVAFHSQQFGLHATMISKVGTDQLGSQLINFLNSKHINTSFIQVDENFSTGTVQVLLDSAGSPNYDIVYPVAWDYITSNAKLMEAVKQSSAFVFGSLIGRNDISRKTLLTLLGVAPFKVLDVNFRKPYYEQWFIEKLLTISDLIKFNEEELKEVGAWYQVIGTEKELIRFICQKFGEKLIIVTKGGDGVICYADSTFYFEAGRQIQVKDTVGSGDAFLAAFLTKYLKKDTIQNSLEYGNAVGALVAMESGGTPVLTPTRIDQFISNSEKN